MLVLCIQFQSFVLNLVSLSISKTLLYIYFPVLPFLKLFDFFNFCIYIFPLVFQALSTSHASPVSLLLSRFQSPFNPDNIVFSLLTSSYPELFMSLEMVKIISTFCISVSENSVCFFPLECFNIVI